MVSILRSFLPSLLCLTLFLSNSLDANDSALKAQLSSHDPIESYFANIQILLKHEKWQEIVENGEKALNQLCEKRDLRKEFSIRDQLVSTYFRLGDFEKAKNMAEHLILLGEELREPELVIDSLYKLSATVRGLAGEANEQISQGQLFNKSKDLTQKALEYYSKHCGNNNALKARVLFNAGAAECDDPHGNYELGITYYREALDLFSDLKEEDYTQRTLIRLGKAYFLEGKLKESREIIDRLKLANLELRTLMHLNYLDAQVLKAEGRFVEAFNKAKEGREIAIELKAKADIYRFDRLIETL